MYLLLQIDWMKRQTNRSQCWLAPFDEALHGQIIITAIVSYLSLSPLSHPQAASSLWVDVCIVLPVQSFLKKKERRDAIHAWPCSWYLILIEATAVLVLESKSELQCLLSFISITSSTGSLFCKSTHSQVQRLLTFLAHFMMRTHVAVVVDRRHLQSNQMFIVTCGRFELTPDKACNLFFCLRWF